MFVSPKCHQVCPTKQRTLLSLMVWALPNTITGPNHLPKKLQLKRLHKFWAQNSHVRQFYKTFAVQLKTTLKWSDFFFVVLVVLIASFFLFSKMGRFPKVSHFSACMIYIHTSFIQLFSEYVESKTILIKRLWSACTKIFWAMNLFVKSIIHQILLNVLSNMIEIQ